MTQPSISSLPSENLQRGVIFALIAVPLGVVGWDIIWSFGFVASIVALGIAYLALRMYRLGSGGRVSRSGAIAVTVITLGTLVIAVISGFAVDLVGEYSRITGASIPESLVSSRFWGIVFTAMSSGQAVGSVLLAGAFGLLGCFGILRATFRQTAAGQPGAVMPGVVAPVDPNSPYGVAPADPNSPYGPAPVVGNAEAPTLNVPSPSNPAGTPPIPTPPSAASPGVILNGEPLAPDERDKR